MALPTFHNKELFEQVFTHRSYLNEGGREMSSNERLEFLGDSILSFIISSYIYKKYESYKEGELTNLRSALTNTENLYKIAQELNLGKHLKLSRGEEISGGRTNKTILADTLEALIGGLFLDQGIDEVRKFIEETILKDIEEMMTENLKDAKSKLQETIQKNHKVSPQYKTIQEEGPDHAKVYTVGVYLQEKLLAEGSGHSKQEAEKEAAENALKQLSD